MKRDRTTWSGRPARRSLFLASLAIFAAAGAALRAAPVLDYSVAARGFAAGGFARGNHVELAVSVAPDSPRFPAPRLSLGYLAPATASGLFAEGNVELGISLVLARMDKHPFAFISHRSTSWTPTLSFAAAFPVADFGDPSLSIGVSPLSFFAGYGTFSGPGGGIVIGGLSDGDPRLSGWYLDLFRFTYPLSGRPRR